VAKATLPVPSGSRILETYGKEIRGKRIEDAIRKIFIIKFFLSDIWFSIVLFLLHFPKYSIVEE